MSKVLSYPKMVEVEYYRRFFEWADEPGSNAGYSFDCDEHGNVNVKDMLEKSYEDCINKRVNVVDKGVRKYINRYKEAGKLLCDCGETVALYGFTNTCDRCGRDYNQSGQSLAPREQWGEETGEYLSDILRIQ